MENYVYLMQDTYSILNNILIIHNIQFVLDKDWFEIS